jgi:hypothetical protein
MITAALLMTYALTGLAVLHTLTLGLKSRTLWLSCTLRYPLVSGGWLFHRNDHPRHRRCHFRIPPTLPAWEATAASRSLNLPIPSNPNLDHFKRRTNMEVILLERVAKLGQMGEVVRVKDGSARNFLLKAQGTARHRRQPFSSKA